MDRPIEATELSRRKRRGLLSLGGGALVVATLLLLLPGWVRPSLERARLTTAVVGRGPIDVTLTASGTIVPELERTITAPGPTRVLRVLRQAGDSVAVGDPILMLDNGAARLEVDRLTRQMAVKANEREQARVDQDNRLSELKSQSAIKTLELESREFDVGRNKKLLDLGVVSGDVLRQSQTDAGRLRIEIEELVRRTANADRSQAVRLHSLTDTRTIGWRWDLAGDLPRVPLDRAQMEQILLNVAKNAMEAIGQDGDIFIRTGRDGARTLIEIEDSGGGIPPEIHDQLFTPFFTSKIGGNGMRLTLVQEVLKSHGFDGTLENAGPGRAVFRIGVR